MLYPIRIKIVIIYKKFFCNHDFFSINFFKSLVNRKEPEPQLVISAPAPGGNMISAPRLSVLVPQHCFLFGFIQWYRYNIWHTLFCLEYALWMYLGNLFFTNIFFFRILFWHPLPGDSYKVIDSPAVTRKPDAPCPIPCHLWSCTPLPCRLFPVPLPTNRLTGLHLKTTLRVMCETCRPPALYNL